MSRPRVAIVSSDPGMRLQAARAFDQAPPQWLVALFDAPPSDADVLVRAPDMSGEGIELDLDDPRATIARVEAALSMRARGRLIEVVSAGGGVGCTSVALHLASFLARTAPAAYVESGASCGGRLRLGLDHVGPSWTEARDPESLMLSALPVPGGFRAVLAPPDDADVSDEVLGWCRSVFGYVVVDRGSSRVIAGDASDVVLVLPPSVPAARRVAIMAQTHAVADWTIVTNRMGPGSEVTDAALGSILGGPRIALSLPCSPLLRDAEDTGRLLGPHASAWSRRILKLSRALARS